MQAESAVPIESASSRDEVRKRALAAKPSWYNPYLHLALPSAFGLGIIGLCLWSLRDLRPLELLAVPLTWLMSNAVEWRVHRDMLHKRSRIAPILYDRHTPMHHRVYVTDDMSIRDPREFGLVLLPAFAIVLICVAVLPLAWGVRLLFGANAALLFVATDLAYVLSYEWLHLSYHLPPGSWVGRLRLVRFLRRHHALHHDPRMMQRWNFNVTVPLWDWVRGTYKVAAPEARIPALDAGAPVQSR